MSFDDQINTLIVDAVNAKDFSNEVKEALQEALPDFKSMIVEQLNDFSFQDEIKEALHEELPDFDEKIKDALVGTLDEFDFSDIIKNEVDERDFDDDIEKAVGNYDFSDDLENAIRDHDFGEDIEEAMKRRHVKVMLREIIDEEVAERHQEYLESEDFDIKVRAMVITLVQDVVCFGWALRWLTGKANVAKGKVFHYRAKVVKIVRDAVQKFRKAA